MKIQNPKKEILSLLATLTILITSNICTKVLCKVLEKAFLLHWEDLSWEALHPLELLLETNLKLEK